MSFYENDIIYILSVGNKYLSVDRSNFLTRELPILPGTKENPGLCFQGDERTGLYTETEGAIGLTSFGFPMAIFSIGQIQIPDKSYNSLSLQLPLLSGNDYTQSFQAKDGTIQLIEDFLFTKINTEGSATISAGMVVRLDSTTGVLRAFADSTSHFGLGVALTSGAPTEAITVAHLGLFHLSDWTAIIGTTNLTVGSKYYLSGTTAGQLTTTAPANVQLIGVAITTTTLRLGISPL